MKKSEKDTKRTPRFVAQTLVVSILMGTVVPSGGLGRVVYAAEKAPEQVNTDVVEVIDAATIGIESAVEEIKQEVEEVKQNTITVGENIISSEALGIVNEAIANKEMENAKTALENGEQKVDEALEGFDTQINNSTTDAKDAQVAGNTAVDEADKAEAALEAAKGAETSAVAKEQEAAAKDAVDAAQNAADTVASEAQSAKDAYLEAEKAYNEALKEAAVAEKEASEALNSAEKNAELAVQKAEVAEQKAQELKDEVEAAREKAEEHFTEKEAALSQAQQELAAAKENLTEVAAKEEVAREELLTATEAVVETGAFLVAAEAYEALSEVTVEGIELAITAMEEAKNLADQALAEAEAALENATGNEEEAQAAYDAALAAYNAANVTLEQANADLEAAKTEQAVADALANSDYGKKLTALEKELIEASNVGDTAKIEEKTQELIAIVIKYDQNSSEAKYDTVELVDNTNMIYEAKDADGNTAYYQYVKNTDESFSFFECNKNETATTVVKTEVVSDLSSVENLNKWEYSVTELDNGSYEVVYYDVKDAENVYTSEEEANNAVAEGGNKEIYAFEVTTEETKEANQFTETAPIAPTAPIEPVDLETFLAENNISEPVDWETYKAQNNITEPEAPTAPTAPTEPETERPSAEAPTLDVKEPTAPLVPAEIEKPTEPKKSDYSGWGATARYYAAYASYLASLEIYNKNEAYKEEYNNILLPNYNAELRTYSEAKAEYETELAAYEEIMGEWAEYDKAVEEYNTQYSDYEKKLAWYKNVTLPVYQGFESTYQTIVDNYNSYVDSYDENYAAYLEEKAQYDEDKAVYDEAKAVYDIAKAECEVANAKRNAALKECLANGDVLTVVVDGVETKVYSNELGLYRKAVVAGIEVPVYDISNYDVTVTNTKTNYRVVEYTETINVRYDMVDTTVDDSYANVTQQVETAQNNFTAASGKVEIATTEKNAAQAAEQVTASELATAEEELANVQKVHNTVAELYDSYYGNEEVEFEIPEEVAKVINFLGITDTSKIISLVEKTGIFETLGIDTEEVYIDITEDGQVTIEIPGTSHYAQHMVALEVAKLAAEENLEMAREVVAEKRADHEAAVDNLEEKVAEYGEAVKELASAAIEVGKAELKVGMATVELTAAEAALEAVEIAEAYAAELVLKAQEARVRVEAAEALVAILKNDITVGSEELAAAEAALRTAKEELAAAEIAAANAQLEADTAKANYEAIQAIVAELEKNETPDEPVNPDEPIDPDTPVDPDEPVTPDTPSNPGSSDSSGSLSDSSSSSSAPATQTVSVPQDMVTIDDEYVPLAETFMLGDMTYVDITPELKKGVATVSTLQMYAGQELFMMAHLGNGIGYMIDAGNVGAGVTALELSARLELVENFAEDFTTYHYIPAKEAMLSYEISTHMQVGAEYMDKTAYIFKKNFVTGLYEIATVTTVSEIGNVALHTKEITEMMIMIMD